MSVRLEHDRISLAGSCPAEDAETLLQALQGGTRLVDLGQAQRLHTAVVQVMLAARAEVDGEPADGFLRTHVMPLFTGRKA